MASRHPTTTYAGVSAVILTGLSLFAWSTANAQSSNWQAQWQKTLAAAKAEGEVIVYSTPSKGHRDGLSEFRKAHPGIKLTLVAMDVPSMEGRVARERAAGVYGFDVYVAGISSTVFTRQIPEGWYDPLKPSLILPEVLDDTKWRTGPAGTGGFDAGFLDEQKKYAYAFSWTISKNIYVNYAHMPPGLRIEKAQDLLDARLKGKMAWLDPRMRQSGSSILATLMVDLNDAQTRQLLAGQAPTITRDGRQIAEWLARGRYTVGLGVNDTDIQPFLKIKGVGDKIEDAPIGTASPSTGGLMLFNRGPHPNAAKVYVNWLLSRDGQARWSASAHFNSRRVDVQPGDPDPATLPQPGVSYFSPNTWKTADVRNRAMKLAEELLGQ